MEEMSREQSKNKMITQHTGGSEMRGFCVCVFHQRERHTRVQRVPEVMESYENVWPTTVLVSSSLLLDWNNKMCVRRNSCLTVTLQK